MSPPPPPSSPPSAPPPAPPPNDDDDDWEDLPPGARDSREYGQALPPGVATPSRRMRKDFTHSYLEDAPADTDKGRSSLPWSEAFRMSMQSIHLRIGRLSVVLIGIALAISFVTGLSYIQMMGDALHERYHDQSGPENHTMQYGWILIAILIAAAGIANAILMSVTERIQEIGTLKCLGARNRHIVRLFLIETLCLGFFGGLAGAVLGPFLAMGLQFTMIGSEAAAGLNWHNFGLLVGYGVSLSLILTLLAAIVPVSFAARVESAEAMRYHV
ncbi:MAG TPA: FtsX-like permease family protein [Planctomycetota bacterium]|nr:FtsX-like permease family protein [Planctomycetota bacterium]